MLASFRTWSILAMVFALMPVGLAQMGGGMMGQGGMMGPATPAGGTGPGTGSGVWQGMGPGAGMGMGGGMVLGMANIGVPTVGPDGTAYISRRLAPSTTQTTVALESELHAINVRDGSTRWKLEVPGWMLSEPVFGKDGKIFLTEAETFMNWQAMFGATSTTAPRKAKLIIITPGTVSAAITNQVEVDSDVLSTPTIANDEAGGYVVYVTGFEMWRMGLDDRDAATAGGVILYAFRPDGSLKFKVKVN